MQHHPQFEFLISDAGACFVSNELREWAGVRGVGLLTAPGEFHGTTADLENLIRVIKRLARKLADDHPELTLASCVSLACFFFFPTTMVPRLEDTRPVQWAIGADEEWHVFTTTMPSEIQTFRISAMNRYLQEARDTISRAQHTTRMESFDLARGTRVMYFRRGKVDSRSDWRSIQDRSLAGTRLCHHDRGSSTMEWIGAFYDRTNRCRLRVTWKQTDQMSSHSAPSM